MCPKEDLHLQRLILFPEGSSTLNELEKSITSPNSVSLFTSDAGKITSHLVGFIPVTSGAEVVCSIWRQNCFGYLVSIHPVETFQLLVLPLH